VRVVVVASDGGRPSTMANDGGERIGGRQSTAVTAATATSQYH